MKKKGLKIHGSNLCNEIHLPTSDDRSAVCCLSSLNLERFDEWKDTTIVRDLIRFLDNVLQFFIDHAGDEISKARYSATQERSLGLGAMGFHSYLQQHRVAFESEKARGVNDIIFKHIQNEAIAETLVLGKERGEAPDMEGTGRRNAHLLAIAPNANSSLIGNTSPSIEPWKANAFTSRTRAGSHLIKNKYLQEELAKIGKDTQEIWSSIITNGGSVQHLDFLDEHLKAVFKTAIELNQDWIVYLGGSRQRYLCQGQSLNVFFPAGASRQYIHTVHYNAWKYGCKGLYYLRTETSNRAENVAQKIERDRLVEFGEQSQEECVACQG
jgi:ribonucleoside-diphosphate reductase alpha chain